jgi:hypothetical protein
MSVCQHELIMSDGYYKDEMSQQVQPKQIAGNSQSLSDIPRITISCTDVPHSPVKCLDGLDNLFIVLAQMADGEINFWEGLGMPSAKLIIP